MNWSARGNVLNQYLRNFNWNDSKRLFSNSFSFPNMCLCKFLVTGDKKQHEIPEDDDGK
jgi:hypothetical protein